MPRRVKLPDGNIGEFPDSMSDADIESVLQKQFPSNAAPAPRVSVGAAPDPWSWAGIKSRAMTLRDQTINQLPTVGGIVGGLVGAGGGIETGPGALLTGTAGAAAGGGLGEDLRQSLNEYFHPEDRKMTPGEAASNIAGQTAAQGASEFVGRGIGNIFRPATAVDKLSNVGNMHPRRVEGALDELLKTERMPGNKVLTREDYKNVLSQTKKRLHNEVTDSLSAPVPVPGVRGGAPLGSTPADPTPISDAIYDLMTKHPSNLRWNPSLMRAWSNRASEWMSQPVSYADMFDRRQVLNEGLNRYEALTAGEKALYAAQHPEIALEKAEADAIRDVIYPKMDAAAGKPTGYFADLQKRYGSVIETARNSGVNIEDVEKSGAVKRGGGLAERMSGSTYMTGGGKPGFALHRIHRLGLAPRPEAALDKSVKSAFGHSLATKAGKAISSNPSAELMALPLREIANPAPPAPKSPAQMTDEWSNPNQ